MKTEAEIRGEIEEITKNYDHVLSCGPADVFINAPRAISQVCTTAQLDILYWMLGEKRPRFVCDDPSKLNM